MWAPGAQDMVKRIGRYQVRRLLGQGAMGVVYAAHDDRLDRLVAIKVIRPDTLADATVRERFRREAKAAARVSHPHICTLYEFDEQDGQPYLVMELLEGESLASRLARGPLPIADAVSTAGPMLDALAALHRSGVIHRDLKPANIFLTPHGLKLLDFGLAHPAVHEVSTGRMRLTTSGVMVGTPQYIAPEQLHGSPGDERSDLFSAAVVIYEMLAGRPPFTGRTLAQLLHAIGTLDPPSLDGSPALVAIDVVLRQALAKDPAQRIGRADHLATRLRDAIESPAPRARTSHARLMRFVALPFRVLRADPDTDFLAFGVPDAVSVALASLESVIVRSPQAAGVTTDVLAIGRDLAVDVVLTGTILHAGARVRVTAQLTDGAAGTLIWSETIEAPIGDLFQLQDTLTQRIVSSLAAPLSARDRRALERQAPASAEAYELYMRANQLMTDSQQWNAARELYERALALDPNYAPAWARLGRARRVLAKWQGGSRGADLMPAAERAFRRALELDPDLAIAYDLSAYAEAELGRAPDAMERLLARVAVRQHEVALLAGLVTTCRYAGLLDASLAAHVRAAGIDRAAATSVSWTHFVRGDYDQALATDIGSPPFCTLLARLVRGDLSAGEVRRLEERADDGRRIAIRAYRQMVEGHVEEVVGTLAHLHEFGFADPEGWYLFAFMLVRAGAAEPAETLLARSVNAGYACRDPLVTRPEWAVLRGRPAFDALVEHSGDMLVRARARFEAANGPALLGVATP
jgi:TolB-like protein/tRNA A-37 threonylcarbamoyl transferase component Bud32/tetratricopeptide (TPR) repeat protein